MDPLDQDSSEEKSQDIFFLDLPNYGKIEILWVSKRYGQLHKFISSTSYQ